MLRETADEDDRDRSGSCIHLLQEPHAIFTRWQREVGEDDVRVRRDGKSIGCSRYGRNDCAIDSQHLLEDLAAVAVSLHDDNSDAVEVEWDRSLCTDTPHRGEAKPDALGGGPLLRHTGLEPREATSSYARFSETPFIRQLPFSSRLVDALST